MNPTIENEPLQKARNRHVLLTALCEARRLAWSGENTRVGRLLDAVFLLVNQPDTPEAGIRAILAYQHDFRTAETAPVEDYDALLAVEDMEVLESRIYPEPTIIQPRGDSRASQE
jgi:hypothetical protein